MRSNAFRVFMLCLLGSVVGALLMPWVYGVLAQRALLANLALLSGDSAAEAVYYNRHWFSSDVGVRSFRNSDRDGALTRLHVQHGPAGYSSCTNAPAMFMLATSLSVEAFNPTALLKRYFPHGRLANGCAYVDHSGKANFHVRISGNENAEYEPFGTGLTLSSGWSDAVLEWTHDTGAAQLSGSAGLAWYWHKISGHTDFSASAIRAEVDRWSPSSGNNQFKLDVRAQRLFHDSGLLPGSITLKSPHLVVALDRQHSLQDLQLQFSADNLTYASLQLEDMAASLAVVNFDTGVLNRLARFDEYLVNKLAAGDEVSAGHANRRIALLNAFLARSPQLRIDHMRIGTPNGEIMLSGDLRLPDVIHDVQAIDPSALLARSLGNLDIEMPRSALETLLAAVSAEQMATRAQQITGHRTSAEFYLPAARRHASRQVETWLAQAAWSEEESGKLRTVLSWDAGKLLLNGQQP